MRFVPYEDELSQLNADELEREYIKRMSELYHAYDTPAVFNAVKDKVNKILMEKFKRKGCPLGK